MKISELRELLYKVDSEAEVNFSTETPFGELILSIDGVVESREFVPGDTGYKPNKTSVKLISKKYENQLHARPLSKDANPSDGNAPEQ